MTVSYLPVAFHPDTASLQVKFWNSDIPDGVQFSVPIPLVDGQYPVGEDLDRVIRAHIPQDIFDAAAAGTFQNLPGGRVTKPALFDSGPMFVPEQFRRLFMRRPLVQINGLEIPIEVC